MKSRSANMLRSTTLFLFSMTIVLCGCVTNAIAQTGAAQEEPTAQGRRFPNPLAVFPKDRILQTIDRRATATLAGQVHRQVRPEFYAGPAAGQAKMTGMILALKRDPEQQQALDALSEALEDPSSPLFHQWLTPENFGLHFGLSQNDLDRVVSWLESEGFTIDDVPAGHWMVVFSGTVTQVESTFQVEIGNYRIGSDVYLANASDPQIPQALSGVVESISGLDNFPPTPASEKTIHQLNGPNVVGVSGNHYLDPSDFATIYNLNPLYATGITGKGVSIAVVAPCDAADSVLTTAQAFWNMEGISSQGVWYWNYGTPPVCKSDFVSEAQLDYEWAGAVAPGSKIWLVSSDSVLGAVQGIVNSGVNNSFVPVISISYGHCENPAYDQTWTNLWQQAHVSGITGIVSSGDTGAASCDSKDSATATHGYAINGYCASPYVVCVGGTQFDDVSSPGSYWSSAGKAIRYIPEVAWNESGSNGGSGLWSSGGGYSTFSPKPGWQTQNTGQYRGVPDVALTSAGHDAYRVCKDATSCNNSYIYAAYGTSAAAPSFAGIIALLVQKTGQPQGDVNKTMYALASRNDLGPIFHDVTQGNNTVPGQPGFAAGPGWDAVTGLGSVDANALISNWSAVGNAPGIVLTSLVPSSAVAGTGILQLTVNGTGFTTGSIVQWNGSALPTTFVSSTQLTASVSSNLIASPGTAAVTVSDNGTISSSLPFTINAATISFSNQRVTTTAPPTSGCSVPPAVSNFLTTDKTVYLYFQAVVTSSDSLNNDWVAPDGSLIQGVHWTQGAGNFCFTGASLAIDSLPSSRLGSWQARVFDNGSLLFTVTFNVSAPQGGTTSLLTLDAGGAAVIQTLGGTGGTQVGYAKAIVNSGVTPYGTAVFRFKQNGVTVSEAGVPASPPTTSARIFIDYRNAVNAIPGRSSAGTIDINTGIAIVNYGSAWASVTYTLRDLNGAVLVTGHGSIPAGNHFAKFIDQFKDIAADFSMPPDFASTIQFGSLDITSDQLISVLATRGTNNQRNEFLFTTTPVADLTQFLNNSPVYFPEFLDGGGYTTSLLLLNTSNRIESGTLQILDNNGIPMIVNQVGGRADSSFKYFIQPNGAFRFQTDGSPADVKVGWVRVTPDAGNPAPVGSGVFDYNPGSILVSESGIPMAASTTHARVYVDLSGNHNTGLAIANLTGAAAAISVNAFQSDGTTRVGASQGALQLAGNGHDARFADQFISGLPAASRGVLEISSTTPFAAITLRTLYNERNEFLFTTFPVAYEDQPAPSPIVFPEFADGGGYVTEFILLSAGGASATTLNFFSEDGNPIAVAK
jgi:pseudomonalisin